MNGERKCAQVSVTEARKLYDSATTVLSEVESTELLQNLDKIQRKIDLEKANGSAIGNLNDYAFLKVTKTKETKQAALATKPDWYQNATHVFVTFRITNGDDKTAGNVQVKFDK